MISQVKSVKIPAQNLKSIVLDGSKKVQELEKKKRFTRERLEEKRLQEEEEKALEKRTKKIQKPKKEDKPKKIFAKIIHNWDKVLTNFKLMDLHSTVLDEKEINFIEETLQDSIPDLQTGAFLHLLDQDKIEGITKNTEGWLDNFKGLTTVS